MNYLITKKMNAAKKFENSWDIYIYVYIYIIEQ